MIVCVCNPDFVETYLLLLKVKHATKAYIVYTYLVYKIIIYIYTKQLAHSIRSNKLTNDRNVMFQSEQRFYCNFLTNVSSVTWSLRTTSCIAWVLITQTLVSCHCIAYRIGKYFQNNA